jgi:hypothetical protein
MSDTTYTSDNPRFDIGPELQTAIETLNEAALRFIQVCAREFDRDPLAATLLGIPPETLAEYGRMTLYEMTKVSQIGAPIVKLRFEDPAVLRALLTHGFSSPLVMREMTKTMALPEINRSNKK